LVHVLRERGHNAHLSYFPDPTSSVPRPYLGYHTAVHQAIDEPGNLIIIPEVWTHMIRPIHHAQIAVWWLSLDNFFGDPNDGAALAQSKLDQDERRSPETSVARATWDELRRVLNFSQSDYASRYLALRNVPTARLDDFINSAFEPPADGSRENVILFNPLKGLPTSERLMKAWPDYRWLPISGMSRDDVMTVLSTSKLYVDFGTHPGRDRLTREALLSGACIIVGNRGTAGNSRDVPVPHGFRLNEADPNFEEAFKATVDGIFDDHRRQLARFDDFIAEIRRQRLEFEHQVSMIFEKPRWGSPATRNIHSV